MNNSNQHCQIISLSSIRGGSGKSTLALALTIFLIRNKKKALLIDFDITGPFLDLIFDVIPKYTITEYIILKGIDVDVQKITNFSFSANLNKLINKIKLNDLEFNVIFSDRNIRNMKICLNVLNSPEGYDFTLKLFNDLKNEFDYDYIIIDNAPGILDTNLLANYISNYVLVILRKRSEELKDFLHWLNDFKKIFRENKNLKSWNVILNKVLDKNQIELDITNKIICEIPFFQKFLSYSQNELNFLINNPDHDIFSFIEKIFQTF
ncbi:MAG: tyrosine-protein kinase family protein [Candidatus Helarchaeota archaeon]